MSVFDNADSVSKNGFVPHKIDNSTVSPDLTIRQRGQDPRHYEIMPQQDAKMTPDQYTEKLQQIETVD